ncbi:MAG: hypothetical protein HC822_11455 [Oscillochloris sp.]|nr:hypothetical protein [Oscillochloris sp.]
MHENFYVFQRRGLGPLLRWGIGSSLAGALLLLVPRPFVRQFGAQAVAWGVIDVLLAIAGRRQALLRAEALATHARDEAEARRDADNLRRILLFNAGLDLLYIAAGIWTARRYADNSGRRGLGVGVLVQGAFLLIYDLLFARAVERFTTQP